MGMSIPYTWTWEIPSQWGESSQADRQNVILEYYRVLILDPGREILMESGLIISIS
jgi:hypothetical protein